MKHSESLDVVDVCTR